MWESEQIKVIEEKNNSFHVPASAWMQMAHH